MVYKWLTKNIEYDCYTYVHEYSKIDRSEDGTYNKGKGVCAGYSKIFRSMCNGLGQESYYISGYTKDHVVKGKTPSSTNHAWNSVKIDGSFYLIDSTWGAGGCDGDKYNPDFNEFYFCTNPQIFIRKHLPAEQKWQLLPQPITIEEFANRADISSEFYMQGFETVSPDLAQFNTEGKISITFTHDSKTKKRILTHLFYLNSGSYVEQENACWVDIEQTSSNMICYANKKGSYKLKIYGGPNNLDSFPYLLEYEISCSKTALKPKGFPRPYNLFFKSDMKIIEPFYNPLTRGKMINFKIKTTSFNNLYITNDDTSKGNTHFRELDKNVYGEFVGEDVYIFGKDVYISTKSEKDDYYNYIVKFTTIRNSNSAVEASFPYSYNAPKNTLYSPLLDTLQIGKIYKFKIKCDSETKIAVVEGNNFTYLNKEGSIFSGNVKINGNSDQIKIVYIRGNSYWTFYRYKIVK